MTCGFAILPGNDHLWNSDGECIVCKINEGTNYERSSTENVQSEDVL